MLRWGILGAGKIAGRFADSLKHVPDSMLYAISGRNMEKLEAFAEKHPCEKIYVGHENMLEDPDLDVIYLALPHALHKEWALKALEKGIPVLCEKPASLNEEEMREIAECAKQHNTLFMEAMKLRFVPAYRKLKAMLEEGVIGDIEDVSASMCFPFPKEAFGMTYHTQAGKGSGALLDGGIYCAGIVEDWMKGIPVPCMTYANYYGFDLYSDAYLKFDNGTAHIESGFDRALPKDAVIRGTKGTVTVHDFHRPTRFVICTDEGETEYEFPYEHDDFYSEIAHFASLVQQGKTESDIMTYASMIREAEILDTIASQFTCYDEADCQVLEAQEKEFAVEQFTSQDALALGNTIVSLLKDYDRGVAVRIDRCADDVAVFQYVSDDKKAANLRYADGKKACVRDTGHSSAWVYVKNRMDGSYEDWKKDGVHVVSGGAFPLYGKDGILAVIQVSGLHEGKDHELIVRALAKQQKKAYTHFIKAIG